MRRDCDVDSKRRKETRGKRRLWLSFGSFFPLCDPAFFFNSRAGTFGARGLSQFLFALLPFREDTKEITYVLCIFIPPAHAPSACPYFSPSLFFLVGFKIQTKQNRKGWVCSLFVANAAGLHASQITSSAKKHTST
nr:hypothetical protein [Pandoravirus aubagnensis]